MVACGIRVFGAGNGEPFGSGIQQDTFGVRPQHDLLDDAEDLDDVVFQVCRKRLVQEQGACGAVNDRYPILGIQDHGRVWTGRVRQANDVTCFDAFRVGALIKDEVVVFASCAWDEIGMQAHTGVLQTKRD